VLLACLIDGAAAARGGNHGGCQFAEELWDGVSYYITNGESVGGSCVLHYKTAQVIDETLTKSRLNEVIRQAGRLRHAFLGFT
jgi:hypothetical protein